MKVVRSTVQMHDCIKQRERLIFQQLCLCSLMLVLVIWGWQYGSSGWLWREFVGKE